MSDEPETTYEKALARAELRGYQQAIEEMIDLVRGALDRDPSLQKLIIELEAKL